MFLQCAHPDCSSDFDYGQGRLFRFQQAPAQERQPSHWHAVKHFWLCARCCETHTIEHQKGLGVLLLQRMDAVAARKPTCHILQEAIARASSMPRRVKRSKARQGKRKSGLATRTVGAIEVIEGRNLERRG
jgi:hypothetical protein